MLDATNELLGESSVEAITVEAVCGRTGIPSAVAARCSISRDDLVVELWLRRVNDVVLRTRAVGARNAPVDSQLSPMMVAMAEEPALTAAFAAIFFGSGAAADRAREQVALGIHRLVVATRGPGSWPEVITVLEFVVAGALVQATVGATTLRRVADQLEVTVGLVLEAIPQH